MRRLAFISCCCLLIGRAAAAAPPNLDAPHAEQLVSGVFAAGFSHKFDDANCGWAVLRDHTLLIDLPRGFEVTRFLAHVQGVTGKPVKRVVVTRVQAGDEDVLAALAKVGVERVDTSNAKPTPLIGDTATTIVTWAPPPRTSARQWQITREEQDKFATHSQNKAEAAKKGGKFKDEIAPVTVKTRKGETVVSEDEYIREGAKLEDAAKLRPAFDKEGTVTAGNASGINDGAAAVVLMTAAEAKKRKLKPLARIASWATAGVDPKIMGSGPIPASRKALEKAGWKVSDLDLIEANEAFARTGARGEQGPRRRHRQGQCQRRRHRHRPSHRRVWRAHPRHALARDAEARRQERSCHALHRWRHGHRHVRRA